jgi:hypothetical protein
VFRYVSHKTNRFLRVWRHVLSVMHRQAMFVHIIITDRVEWKMKGNPLFHGVLVWWQ